MANIRETLKWSDAELSLRKFVCFHGQNLPAVVVTTTGFSDGDNMNDVGADEIYWVYAMSTQKRVIAKSEFDRYISIPLNYRLQFQRLTNRNSAPSKPMALREILVDGPSGQRVQLASTEPVLFDFTLEGQSDCHSELGVLEILDMYDEKFLLTHSLIDGEMYQTTIGIPVYLPIALKVAEGTTESKNRQPFDLWMKEIQSLADNFDHTKPVSCDEILVFDRPPSGDYEYINPCKYARLTDSGGSGGAGGKSPKNVQETDTDSDDSDGYVRIDSKLVQRSNTDTGRGKPRHHTLGRQPSTSSAEVRPDLPPPRRSQILPPMVSCKVHAKPANAPSKPQPKIPTTTPQNATAAAADDDRSDKMRSDALSRSAEAIATSAKSNADNANCETSKRDVGKKLASTNDFFKHYRQINAGNRPVNKPPVGLVPAQKPTRSGNDVTTQNRPSYLSVLPDQPAAAASTGNSPVAPPVMVVNPLNQNQSDPDTKKSETTDGGDHKTGVGDESSWTQLREIPRDVENFDVAQVVKCVEMLGMPTVAASLGEQQVDGQLLVSGVTKEMLMGVDFKCSEFQATRLVMFAKGWRPK